jgi:hypothetical protein
LTELLDLLVNLSLNAFWACEFTFRIRSLEDVAVVDEHLQETVWEISVSCKPLLRAPALVSQDNFNKKEVRQRVSDSLVDEVYASAQDLEVLRLGWRLGLVFLDGLQRVVGENGGAVAIGFEVDTNVKLLCGVVKILHSCRRAGDREAEVLLDVVRRCAIGVRSLYDTDLDLVREARCAYKIAKEGRHKCSNAVTVKESEHVLVILEVVYNTISITVE